MRTKNYIFIGDSLTFGYGVNKSKSWVEFIKDIVMKIIITIKSLIKVLTEIPPPIC